MFFLSYITIHQCISVASAIVIRTSYKNTNNIQTIAQNYDHLMLQLIF